MGNTASLHSGLSTPTSSRSNRAFTFKINHHNIYNEILKDAQKLRLQDKKNDYNPHRRAESIALNLPKQLQSYSNAIHIVNEFWLDHIEKLSSDELNKLVMVLYCHLFLKCKDMRNILLIAQKNNISSHAIKIFNVFGYVIRNLIHPSNHLKLFRQLQALGTVHRSYSLTNANYESILEAFNFSMEEKFANNYKIRTRFCFSQIYRVIVDIMTGEDFYSFAMRQLNNNNTLSPILKRLSSGRNDDDHIQTMHGIDTSSSSSSSSSLVNINDNDLILDDEELHNLQSLNRYKRSSTQRQAMMNQIDGFLGSLEECLCDDIGSLYFKKYLEEQFCVENYLFHQVVLKYKSAKSTQRIKLGEEIIEQFVEIGSEKEVNLSYNTRKQILTIVNLVKKMNDNKEKYQQLLSTKRKNKDKNIMDEDDDMRYINNRNGHYRMATTKKLPLELAEITSDANENIQDVIYSMGYTQSLFDKAYDEIFNLMRTNSWNTFRNAILEYCGDDEFVKLQREKLITRQQEQRNNLSMIQAINSITRSHRKYTQKSIQDILKNNNNNNNNNKKGGVMIIQKQTRFKHQRKKSTDDFDLNYSTQVHAHYNPTSDEIVNDSDDDSGDDDKSVIIKQASSSSSFNKPRLSFIPKLIPSIEKSVTSPTVQMNSTYMTPIQTIQTIPSLSDTASYSPSELFTLVSAALPEHNTIYKNGSFKKKKSSKHKSKSKRNSIKSF